MIWILKSKLYQQGKHKLIPQIPISCLQMADAGKTHHWQTSITEIP